MSAIVILLLLAAVAVADAGCSAAESAALLDFKASLADPGGNLRSWSNATDCCRWRNVACAAAGVTGIDLAGFNLSLADAVSGGDGFSQLAALVNLVALNLSRNKFGSLPIPSSLAGLPRLAHLNLSNAGFSGSVPLELGRVRSLLTLDLSVTFSVFFGGGGKLSVKDAGFFSDIPNLEEIYLDGVDLSASLVGDGCRSLAAAAPKLRVVSLSKCSMNCPLEALVSDLNSLTYLGLDGNNLSSGDALVLLKFSSLAVVRVSSCGLVGQFPVGIFQLSSLKLVDTSFNQNLTGELLEFPWNNTLRELILSSTNFSGNLSASVGNLTSLAKLDFSNANFSGELPVGIGMLDRLEYLDLSSNNFNGLVPSLARMKRLVYLDLSFNMFGGPLPEFGDTIQTLLLYNVGSNLFSGLIPKTICTLPSLQKLLLYQNNLSGSLSEFRNASRSSLSSLDLSGNQLQGLFPKSIYSLPRLKVLKLSSNNFSGVVELDLLVNIRNLSTLDLSNSGFSVEVGNRSISNFSKLAALKLASCKMTKVPEFLRSQQLLIDLDLSDNKISGVIPDWLLKLDSLDRLNLSHNQLEDIKQPLNGILSRSPNVIDLHANKLKGPIPLFTNTSVILDFSGNMFLSSIPTDIGSSLLFSSYFSLSNNQLNGSIPGSMCNASTLVALDLSGNNLSGSIPTCLTRKMVRLKVLNLRSNSIGGTMPRIFSKNCSLKTLDLNGNRIVGQIPISLLYCKSLEVLNLGNNNVEGNFPLWLGQMQKLRVLVLRSNRFQGHVEPPLEPSLEPSFPMLQILDLSSNYFTGNLCSPCFSTWKSMVNNGNESDTHVTAIQSKLLQLTPLYYRDTVKVTIKGLEIEIEKILTVFTALDLSNNTFSGLIPETIGDLNKLYFLNLSHNALAGPIPRSIGYLSQLESLDFSFNSLTDEIPSEILELNFLSILNLSFNQLVGNIPQGFQLNTFQGSSYLNNSGLCGRPLNISCKIFSSGNETSAQSDSSDEFEWKFIIAGLGFGGGLAVSLVLLVLWRKGQKWFSRFVDRIFENIFPVANIVVLDYDKRKTETVEDFKRGFIETVSEGTWCLEGNYC